MSGTTRGRSGLVALADGVRAYFEAQQIPAVVTPVGFRYRAFKTNQGPGGGSRVCFIPGKVDPTSDQPPKVVEAGTFGGPTFQSDDGTLGIANPRRLVQWDRIVSLSVWGVDVDHLADEEKQIKATEDLLEMTFRAMHYAVDPVSKRPVGLANLHLDDAVWVIPPVEQAFGREFFAYFTLSGPLFDAPDNIAFPTPAIIRSPAS